MTNLRINPLAYTNVDWTNAMVADLRKYETGVKKVIPSCWKKNMKTVNVSIHFFFRLIVRKGIQGTLGGIWVVECIAKGCFSNRTGTSVDNGARIKNTHI